MLNLRYAIVDPRAIPLPPTGAYTNDAGIDISIIAVDKVIDAHTTLYDTGIRLLPPTTHGVGWGERYYIELVPRSSIIKSGYMMSNSVGIIDPTYRGNIKVALTKLDLSTPPLDLPMRVCQLIARPLLTMAPECIPLDEYERFDTVRGDGGFGSSG
jgi:dUTP pyrophosphatase